jgi:hypothetical protein
MTSTCSSSHEAIKVEMRGMERDQMRRVECTASSASFSLSSLLRLFSTIKKIRWSAESTSSHMLPREEDQKRLVNFAFDRFACLRLFSSLMVSSQDFRCQMNTSLSRDVDRHEKLKSFGKAVTAREQEDRTRRWRCLLALVLSRREGGQQLKRVLIQVQVKNELLGRRSDRGLGHPHGRAAKEVG